MDRTEPPPKTTRTRLIASKVAALNRRWRRLNDGRSAGTMRGLTALLLDWRTHASDQHPTMCRVSHDNQRLSRILRVLVAAVIAGDHVEESRPDRHLHRTLLQHHGDRRCNSRSHLLLPWKMALWWPWSRSAWNSQFQEVDLSGQITIDRARISSSVSNRIDNGRGIFKKKFFFL